MWFDQLTSPKQPADDAKSALAATHQSDALMVFIVTSFRRVP
jgi:hypothetical protein